MPLYCNKYIDTYTELTEAKGEAIFEKTRELLAEYELTGISKNELARLLQKYGIASRMTFYEYFDDMLDPNGANIIRQIVPAGKINAMLFPTPSNQALIALRGKFKIVKNLLDMIEEYPLLGDTFLPVRDLSDIYKSDEILPPETGVGDNSVSNVELIHAKKTSFGEVEANIILRSHKARHDFLKELPLFLTTYLNLPKRNYSKQVKEESIKILTPIFLRSLTILNAEYSESLNVSKNAKELIHKTAPKDSAVFVYLIKSPPMPNLEVEFLKILGRYYYSISKQFSKNMEFDSSKEQKLVSTFITSFYDVKDSEIDSKEELNSDEIKKIISLNDELNLFRDKDAMLIEYGFDKDSIAIKLLKSFTKEGGEDDAVHILLYYWKLFFKLGIFTKREQQVMNYIIAREQERYDSLKPYDPREFREGLRDLFPKAFPD